LQLSSDPAERESRLRESAQFFASFLDDLGTLAKDRQQQKEAGYQDQSSFNILVETATDGIISIDDQSTITYANPAMGRMFGYEVAELLGKELTSLMPERFRAKHLTALGKYVTTGQRHLHWRRIELVGCTRTVENSRSRSRLARPFAMAGNSSPESCAMSASVSESKRRNARASSCRSCAAAQHSLWQLLVNHSILAKIWRACMEKCRCTRRASNPLSVN
jgi:PAS domain S-box-containing protein